jgi:hypothetical protein
LSLGLGNATHYTQKPLTRNSRRAASQQIAELALLAVWRHSTEAPEKLDGTEELDGADEYADDSGPQEKESDPEQETEPAEAAVANFFKREDHGDGGENRADPPVKGGLKRELARCVEGGGQIGDAGDDGEAEEQ